MGACLGEGKQTRLGRTEKECDGITLWKTMTYHFSKHRSFIQLMFIVLFSPKNDSVDRKGYRFLVMVIMTLAIIY